MGALLALLLSAPFPPGPCVQLEDLDLFPSLFASGPARASAEARAEYLEARIAGLGGWEAEQLWPALRDARERAEVWKLLEYASLEIISADGRLESLEELRRRIGWPAYYRGEMPAPVSGDYLRLD
jgi:hypothetical protein